MYLINGRIKRFSISEIDPEYQCIFILSISESESIIDLENWETMSQLGEKVLFLHKALEFPVLSTIVSCS